MAGAPMSQFLDPGGTLRRAAGRPPSGEAVLRSAAFPRLCRGTRGTPASTSVSPTVPG